MIIFFYKYIVMESNLIVGKVLIMRYKWYLNFKIENLYCRYEIDINNLLEIIL